MVASSVRLISAPIGSRTEATSSLVTMRADLPARRTADNVYGSGWSSRKPEVSKLRLESRIALAARRELAALAREKHMRVPPGGPDDRELGPTTSSDPLRHDCLM